ncbi:MAG TPA: hypothetical protein VHM02_11775, partial [Thermoanaerobaculia bacterium]|nr:hypothetical protein [Thermoanaerobaculia bacterium]
ARSEKAPADRVREALGGDAAIRARLRRDKAARRLLGDDPEGAAAATTHDETEAAVAASEG